MALNRHGFTERKIISKEYTHRHTETYTPQTHLRVKYRTKSKIEIVIYNRLIILPLSNAIIPIHHILTQMPAHPCLHWCVQNCLSEFDGASEFLM